MPRTGVGLMAKFPEIGRVKTRLAAKVGDEAALGVYFVLLSNIASKTLLLSSDEFICGAFAMPDDKIAEFSALYPGFEFYDLQRGNNLGERMRSALTTLITQPGIDKAMLIGADIPDLGEEQIREADKLLNGADLVLGPTQDGGYYLIGLKKVHSQIFTSIDWGTSTVLEKTKEAAERCRMQVALLPELRDLDDLADLDYFAETK